MATQVQFRGGTTTEHSSFNGAAREVTVDTTKQTLVVQDGTTNGGFPLLREKNPDNVKVHFGGNGTTDAGYLQIYSDGTNNQILSSNGDIVNTVDTGHWFYIKTDAGNDVSLIAKPNAGVTLYWDDSPKVSTTSAGVGMPSGTYFQFDAASSNAWAIGATTGSDSPTGEGTALQYHHWNNSSWDKVSFQTRDGIGVPDGKKLLLGDSSNLQIYHNVNSFIENTTGILYLDSAANGVNVLGELRVEDVEGTTLRLGNTAAAASDGDYLSGIDFHIKDNNDATGAVSAAIRSHADQNHTATAKGTALSFHTTDDDTTTLDERMRITHDGKCGIGVTGPTSPLHVKGIDTTIGVHTYPQLTLETESTDGAADKGSGIMFLNHDGNGGKFGGGIRVLNENATVLNHASYMSFTTRPAGGSVTEALKIASTGEVSVQAGNLKLTSGNGIDFSASSNQAGVFTGGETLTDYECGTYTPNLLAHGGSWVTASLSSGNKYGSYVKIGNMVHVQAYFTDFHVDSAHDGDLVGISLPITADAGNTGYSALTTVHANCFVSAKQTNFFVATGNARAYGIQEASTSYDTWRGEASRYLMVAGTYRAG